MSDAETCSDGSNLFESFHQLADKMRSMLADGGDRKLSPDDLATIWEKCKQISEFIEQVAIEGAQLQESITAIGKTVKAECERREREG